MVRNGWAVLRENNAIYTILSTMPYTMRITMGSNYRIVTYSVIKYTLYTDHDLAIPQVILYLLSLVPTSRQAKIKCDQR